MAQGEHQDESPPPPPYQEMEVAGPHNNDPESEQDERPSAGAEPSSDPGGHSEDDPGEDNARKPGDVTFSFGPDGTYFVKVDGSYNICTSLETSKSINTSNIRQLFALGLTEDGGFMMAYDDKDKGPTWTWVRGPSKCILTGPKSEEVCRFQANHLKRDIQLHHLIATAMHKAYRNLFAELCTHTSEDELKRTSLSFGRLGAYWTRIDYETNYNDGVPQTLTCKVNAKKEIAEKTGETRVFPLQVGLGPNGTWTVIWSDKSWSWNLGSSEGHSQLTKILKENDESPVFVALSPYSMEDFFLVRGDGLVMYRTGVMSGESGRILNRMCLGYMQRRAKKDGTSFRYERTVGKVTTSFMITPETDFPNGNDDEDSSKSLPHSTASRYSKVKIEGPRLEVMRYRASETWRRFQMSRLGRRESLVAMGVAGICTMSVCNVAGLPRRHAMAATAAAVLGTGAGMWTLARP